MSLTFPVTILAAGSIDGFNGPFADGANLFAFGVDNATTSVRAYKSVDGGATWVEQDSGNAKLADVAKIAACQDPATHNLHIVYLRASDSTFTLSSFNTTTGLWGATITSSLSDANAPSTLFGACIFRAGSNSVVYSGSVLNGAGGIRCAYAVCAIGGAWDGSFTRCADTTDTGTAINWSTRAMCLGASGSIHILFTKSQLVFPFLASVYQQQLTSGGALGTLQQVYTTNELLADPEALPLPCNMASRTVTGGVEVWVIVAQLLPFVDGSSADSLAVVSGLSADTITFTSPTIIPGQAPSLVLVHGTGISAGPNGVNAFWSFRSGSTASYYYCPNTGGGFGTSTLLGTITPGLGTQQLNTVPMTGAGNLWMMSFSGSVLFFAFGAGVTPVGVSQLVFYGVRRIKNGPYSDPAPSPFKYTEKPYALQQQIIQINQRFNGAIPLLGQGTSYQIPINDFGFELRHITKYCTDGNGAPLSVPSVFAMVLYDSVKVARSNFPVLAEYLCDDTTVVQGRVHFPAPPIYYKDKSVLSFDIFSLIPGSITLPVTINLLFEGVRRYPC